MNNYKPNLYGRDIVMISDYVDEYFTQSLIEEEKIYLEKTIEQIRELGFKIDFIERKTIKEIAEELKRYEKDKIIVFNWFEEEYDKPNTPYLATEFLEEEKYMFTGGTTKSVLLDFDKVKIKEILKKNKVRIPKYCWTDKKLDKNPDIEFPLIVKALREHGSTGLQKTSAVKNLKELNAEIKRYKSLGIEEVIIEQFISGREFSVSIIGNKKPEVLEFRENIFKNRDKNALNVYDFASKWEPGTFEYTNTLNEFVSLKGKAKKDLEEITLKAFKALNLKGWARFEVRKGKGKYYILDANVNAQLTLNTDLVLSALDSGYNYGTLILRICQYEIEDSSNIN